MKKVAKKKGGKAKREKPQRLISPHDLFFRAIFQRVLEMQHLMDALFPPEFVSKIDKNFFVLDATTYVDESLMPGYSDISYLTRLLSQELLRVNIMIEHKGQVPKLVLPEHIQIATYKVGVWRQDFLNKRKPTFVFAALLYHGKRKFNQRSFDEYFEALPPEWKPYVDDIKFFVIDLNKLTDEEILSKLGGTIMGSALLALKHAHEPKYFETNLAKLLSFDWQKYPPELLVSFVKTLFFYLEKVTKMKPVELIQKAKSIPHEMNLMMNLTIESVYSEGMEEGMEKGMEKGINIEAERKNRAFVTSMLQNCPDFSDEKIALIAAVPIEFVLKIKKELAAPLVKAKVAPAPKTKKGTRPVNGRRRTKTGL